MRRYPLFLILLLFMSTSLSCSTSAVQSSNPLLSEWDTPFGVPPFEDIKPEHYMPAFEVAMAEHNAEIAAIVECDSLPTFENVILAFDNSGQLLSDIYNIFGMISGAETNDELQALNEELSPILTAHFSKIDLNEELFSKIKTVYDYRETEKLDAEQLRLLDKIYTSFIRGGALLEGEEKSRLEQIDSELALLGVRFGQNLLAENNKFSLILGDKELDGLPSGVRAAAKDTASEKGLKDKWVFTLQAPSWIPFLTYSSKRELREELYKAYISRGNNDDELDNKMIINDMVRLRAEKAQLLGYNNYADFVISNEMATSVPAVYDMLNAIWDPALESAKEELAAMEELFKKDFPDGVFESWDWWYYAEALRKKKYNLDEEMLRPYLSLANVQSGAFMLANRLYGVTFRPVAVPHYHEDCTAYEVLDVDNSHIGVLYFDFHPRAGKSQGAWCGNYSEQRYVDGERIAPVVSIVCNFTRPSGNTPSLLSVDEAQTLFHEFGHSLHFLFHDVKYRGLSEVEGDFVELPSQIMENWAFEPEMLSQYAFHHRTKKPITDDLIKKIGRAARFNQGFMTTELVAAALSDLDIHSISEYEQFDVEAFERDALTTRRGLIPQVEPRYHYTYFSHIFDGGYSAGYYFYLWAERLDKDAFNAFKESGDLFNKKLAASFRTNILERGGSESGMDMYLKFRGAEPANEPMLIARGLLEVESDEDQEVLEGVELDEAEEKEPVQLKKAIEKTPKEITREAVIEGDEQPIVEAVELEEVKPSRE